jgi:hypothetical protein
LTIDLPTAAKLSRQAAIDEVFDTMDAHGRYYPAWEVQELGINYAIRNRLLAHFRNLPPPLLRVGCEYGVDAIKNIAFEAGDRHPVDLAVLYPILEATGDTTGAGFAWAPQNCAVLGLIEVKKNSLRAKTDARFLSEVLSLPSIPDMRPLQWVLLVVFVSGPAREYVNNMLPNKVDELDLISEPEPREVEEKSGSENVHQRWFDIRCYGKEADRGRAT